MIIARSLPGSFEAAGTPPVLVTTAGAGTDRSTSNTISLLSSSPLSGVAASAAAAAAAAAAAEKEEAASLPPPPRPTAMAQFFQTTLLPILIALALYLILCHAIIPLYRKHRARYSQYLPLAATSSAASALSSRLPRSMHPSTIRSRAMDGLARLFMPSRWALRHSQPGQDGEGGGDGRRSGSSSFSNDEHLLTDESGEALVNFDFSNNTGTIEDQNRRRRDAMERQVARGLQAAREMGMGMGGDDDDSDDDRPLAVVAAAAARVGGRPSATTSVPPERRLSRDLEEGFRDDSDDDDSQGDEDGDNAVTLGRGRVPVLTVR